MKRNFSAALIFYFLVTLSFAVSAFASSAPDAQSVVNAYIELQSKVYGSESIADKGLDILGYGPSSPTEPPEQAAYLIAPRIDAASSLAPALLLWSPAEGKIVAHHPLEGECKAVSAARIQWLNLDSDETPELFIELDAVCLSPERVDGYRVTRLLGFDLPSLEPILSQNGAVVLYGRDNVQTTKRTYRITPASGGQAGSIEIVDLTQSRKIGFDSPPDERLASTVLETAEQEELRPRGGVLTCRFIDDAGQPIPGLKVPYSTKTLNLFASNLFGLEKVTKHEAVTNNAGICEIEYNRLGVNLGEIKHPDYYPIRILSFNHRDADRIESNTSRFITDEVIDIVLNHRLEQVAMHRSTRRSLSLDLRNLPVSFGISFEVTPEEDKKVNLREIAEMGDLGFTIEIIDENLPDGEVATLKEQQAYNRNRRLTIKGLNGWKLRAAPEIPWERLHDEINEAPLDGYDDTLVFEGLETPRYIFLSKDEGRRYGLLSDARLTLDNFKETGIYKFSYHYRVQAEATGSRSLDRMVIAN